MDAAWTPGGGARQKKASKDTLDDLLGDLLDDEAPPKKKSAQPGRQQFSTKKQSSKDEDFYSSLAQAADEDGDVSDVSEADVNKMAKSIADLDDLDADLFPTGPATAAKTPKRGSLKDKSGKPGTPRRSGTPRSRGSTPRAASPPLRLTSPANRVISPTHQRVTSPGNRGTPPGGRETPNSPAGGIDPNRSGSGGAKKSPTRKPQTPETAAEYRPTTAPGKMTDLNERASVGLKPGQEQERPRTVPKAKSMDFGEFDADDPLAGIPLSDEDEDLGLPKKRSTPRQQQQQQQQHQQQQQQQQQPKEISPRAQPKETSPRPTAILPEPKQESPRQRSMFDRPPTRSGSMKTETPEAEPKQQAQKPAPVKKKAEETLFSDDDDFLGGLGIEEKGAPPKPKPKAVVVAEEEEDRPARSAMDKLLGKDSGVSKHLEPRKERREFVLDTKYTQPQGQGPAAGGAGAGEEEDDYMFGSYMPSAVGSNSSRPTSRRSVRFQDDDDIFGLNDEPAQPTSRPAKKADDMDWLEMATSGSKTQADKPADKPKPAAEPKPEAEPVKPSTAPSKPKSSAADWLGLQSDEDDGTEYDFLKASSFSTPARPGIQQPAKKPADKPTVSQPAPEKLPEARPAGGATREDYLGLGEEVDPSKLLRSKNESPKSGGAPDVKSVLQEDDIFDTQSSAVHVKPDTQQEQPLEQDDDDEDSRKPLFESAARRQQMVSPRFKKDSPRRSPGRSPGRSPERKSKDSSPRSLVAQLAEMQNQESKPRDPRTAGSQPLSPPRQPQPDPQQPPGTPDDELNSSTDFFSFKRKTSDPNKDRSEAQSGLENNQQTGLQNYYQTDLQTDSQQLTGSVLQPGVGVGGMQQFTGDQMLLTDPMAGMLQQNLQQQQQQQQQQQRQQQLKQQQQLMKQLQRQQQQFQKQQQQQMQQIQQMAVAPEPQMMPIDRPMFMDDMSFGMGGQVDLDAQSKIRRLEVELQYARDILTSTKARYEEEIDAIKTSYSGRVQLIEETNAKREQRWREESESLMSQHLGKLRKLEEEKSELMSGMYRKLEEAEQDKATEVDRLKDIHRLALDTLKKDHDESLSRLKRSKDQQIEVAAASHDTSKSLVATVELIQNNAKDLGVLQRKIDSWNAQGLDDREINLRAKDEQLKMLEERLTKQQEDTEQERHRLQELVGRLEAQIREQTRMLEEERWKVKQEQSRLQGLQTALEDERRSWSDHQARERTNMEKIRESLLEEQKSTLGQLHRERQTFADEQVAFNIKQKLAREEGSQFLIKSAQAKAELEALTRAVAEAKDKYEGIKDDCRREEDHMQDERRRLEKERTSMDKKEEELMQSALLLQNRSKEIEDTYEESQRKHEEGLAALGEAQRLEAEENKRIELANHQLNMLKMKEKEISDERLRLSKEKREHEKFRNTLLCPNCRRPTKHGANGNINYQMNEAAGLLMAAESYQGTNGEPTNGYPGGSYGGINPGGGYGGINPGMMSPVMQAYNPAYNPAIQLSVNTVDSVTEAIKSDRSIRLWKMEAMKDQKYLEEQSLFLHSLKCMPYSSPKS